MRQPIQLNSKNRSLTSALQANFLISLIFTFAILLARSAVATPTLGNYPDTSLPLSTDSTVTPDAAPANTTSINVSTSSDFHGTLEGDPTTGVVRVTDAHPAGIYTVTVTAFDNGGATAIKTFTLTVITPVTCASINFSVAAITLTNNRGPSQVAVGDFNGDGKQDLAVANFNSDNVSISLGDGAGNFSGATNFGAGNTPWSVAVGDFNGDGKQDLAVTSELSGNVSILLGNGDGTFSAPTVFAAGTDPTEVVVGDFNGDGKQDLAIASEGLNKVSILLGNGDGTFSGATFFAAGSHPFAVAVGDFNGDGKQDLAVANFSSDNVSILLGDGTGNFSAATNFPVGVAPFAVTIGDFNGDGKQDIAVANFSSDNVSILLGDGTGTFSAGTNFTVGTEPRSVAVGDFNGDRKQDLALINRSSDNVSILLGDGTGTFNAATNFTVGDSPVSVAVGDFNGDGKQDLAVANNGSDNVSILLRDCQVSQITDVGTTCSQFSSGTAQTLGSVQYSVNNDLINRFAPGTFLYWVTVTAPAGNNIFTIKQTITTGNFDTFFADVGNGSNVFDSDCVRLQRAIRQSGDTVTVRFNAPAAGTYFISIKFNSQNLIGEPAPSPITVHYDFMTTGAPDSTSGLDLVKRH